MIRFSTIYLLLIITCLGLGVKESTAQMHIIPQPLHVTTQKGSFVLNSKALIGAFTGYSYFTGSNTQGISAIRAFKITAD